MQEEHVEMQYLVELSTATTPTTETVPNLLENVRPILKRYPYLGVVLATLSSFFFSLCSLIVKSLDNVNPIQLVMFRFIGVLIPTIPIVVYTEQPVFPQGSRRKLVMRSIVGIIGMMTSFYAFQKLPLGESSVIVYSSPAFVTLYAKKFLKQPSSRWEVVAIALTVIGVSLIVYPTFDFVSPIHTIPYEEHIYNLACGLAFISMLFSSAACVIVRNLKALHFSVLMTNDGVIGFILTIVVLYLFGAICMPTCGTERVLIVCLALSSYLGQVLLTMALQMEEVGFVTIARSADILFACVWQLLFFDELPTILALIGGCLVIISILILGIHKLAVVLPPESQLRANILNLYL